MSGYDYQLFVIGAGSGGVRVAIAENRYLGGTCVNVGCMPKKLFVYASSFRDDFIAARGYGWSIADPRFDWQRIKTGKSIVCKMFTRICWKAPACN